jgi:NADH:ubiquinone oxidoreductase subunit 6 (subunit J)
VTVTVTVSKTLGPGVYLIPAIVRPRPPKSGNIHIQRETIALVTFQIPGATAADLKATFIGAVKPSGARSTNHHVPGLPAIQIGTSGSEVLQVFNDSSASLYSYNEITASQTPFGTVVFKGHTAGEPQDLRHGPAVYFPNLYRDYPITWHPSTLGIGTGHLTAYISYHPNPNSVSESQTSTEVLVASPLWIFLLIVCLGAAMALLRRRTMQQAKGNDKNQVHRGLSSRVGQAIGSLILLFVVAVGAFLSSQVVFVAVGAVGVAMAALLMLTNRRRNRALAARRLGVYEAFTGLILLIGVASVLLSVLSTLSADIAVALVSGAGIWTLLAWWAQWWNEERLAAESSSTSLGGPGYDQDEISTPV